MPLLMPKKQHQITEVNHQSKATVNAINGYPSNSDTKYPFLRQELCGLAVK